MPEMYNVSLGGYAFTCQPVTSIKSTSVIRESVSPNVRVALLYEWRMRCRVPATTDALATVPPSAATNLGTFLTSQLHTRTMSSSLAITDSAAAAIPVIGDVSVSGGWEDLQLVEFDMASPADATGQLVAGAWFELLFRARKSLADANGICELELEHETSSDESGREVRRVSGLVRLSLAAYSAPTNARITDAAVVTAGGYKLACPAGWNRSRGNNTNGFDVRYPKYPRLHEAFVVSEVTQNGGGVAGPSGSKSADVSLRVRHDPSKGVVRTTTRAETAGAEGALAWVVEQQPAESTGETLEETSKKAASGEWETIGPLTTAQAQSDKVTKVRRRYSLSGGERPAGETRMASGEAVVTRAAGRSAYRLRESIDVQAQGLTLIGECPAPAPLSLPWVLDGERPVDDLAAIDEDADYPAMRLWVRVLEREYFWAGKGDPRENAALIARVEAAGRPETNVLEVT